ncbi:MAG: polysaccharide biosynthesis C-terminal domain-containing protein, partial [Chloroflexota bacterium]|nr:polysaccharide biosynthesis C-terminal domain-containing protein [Chloroflexota bacterium]
VAVGQLCMAIIAGLLDFGMVKRVINVSFRDIFKSIQAALVAALGMGVAVWLFVSNSPNIWPGFALAGAVCIGIIMYAALLWVIERQFVLETSRTVLHVLRPERPTLARQER